MEIEESPRREEESRGGCEMDFGEDEKCRRSRPLSRRLRSQLLRKSRAAKRGPSSKRSAFPVIALQTFEKPKPSESPRSPPGDAPLERRRPAEASEDGAEPRRSGQSTRKKEFFQSVREKIFQQIEKNLKAAVLRKIEQQVMGASFREVLERRQPMSFRFLFDPFQRAESPGPAPLDWGNLKKSTRKTFDREIWKLRTQIESLQRPLLQVEEEWSYLSSKVSDCLGKIRKLETRKRRAMRSLERRSGAAQAPPNDLYVPGEDSEKEFLEEQMAILRKRPELLPPSFEPSLREAPGLRTHRSNTLRAPGPKKPQHRTV